MVLDIESVDGPALGAEENLPADQNSLKRYEQREYFDALHSNLFVINTSKFLLSTKQI